MSLSQQGLRASGRRVRLSAPLPLYVVGADAVTIPESLPQLVPSGHRVVVELDGDVIGYADFGPSTRGGDDTFQQFSSGELARHLVGALRRALRETGGSAAQLAILDIPAHCSAAVWIRGATDRFVPYAPYRKARKPSMRQAATHLRSIAAGRALRARLRGAGATRKAAVERVKAAPDDKETAHDLRDPDRAERLQGSVRLVR